MLALSPWWGVSKIWSLVLLKYAFSSLWTWKRGQFPTQECVRLWISWIFPDLGDIPPICEKTHCRAISIIISPLPHRTSRLVSAHSSEKTSFTVNYLVALTQLPLSCLLWWTRKGLGVGWLDNSEISYLLVQCPQKRWFVWISRFLDFSWYLFGLESRAQMLNYGKPVMGLPLCQTELDEGLGHLDILDHLQKMQDFHWLASHWIEWLSDDRSCFWRKKFDWVPIKSNFYSPKAKE